MKVAGAPNVVVLGDGPYQRPIIRYLLRHDDVYVISPVVTETTRAASGHIACDILDVDRVIDHIRRLPAMPLFVVSDQSDVATVPVALISEHSGLLGNSPASARIFMRKELMCEHLSSDIAPWVSVIDFHDCFHRLLVGEPLGVDGPVCERPALLKSFREPDVRTCPLDSIRSIPGVLEYVVHSKEEYVRNPDNCRDSCLIALAQDAAHLDATIRELDRVLKSRQSRCL